MRLACPPSLSRKQCKQTKHACKCWRLALLAHSLSSLSAPNESASDRCSPALRGDGTHLLGAAPRVRVIPSARTALAPAGVGEKPPGTVDKAAVGLERSAGRRLATHARLALGPRVSSEAEATAHGAADRLADDGRRAPALTRVAATRVRLQPRGAVGEHAAIEGRALGAVALAGLAAGQVSPVPDPGAVNRALDRQAAVLVELRRARTRGTTPGVTVKPLLTIDEVAIGWNRGTRFLSTRTHVAAVHVTLESVGQQRAWQRAVAGDANPDLARAHALLTASQIPPRARRTIDQIAAQERDARLETRARLAASRISLKLPIRTACPAGDPVASSLWVRVTSARPAPVLVQLVPVETREVADDFRARRAHLALTRATSNPVEGEAARTVLVAAQPGTLGAAARVAPVRVLRKKWLHGARGDLRKF